MRAMRGMAMNNRKKKSNKESKGHLQTRSLPEELANLYLRTAEYKRNGGNFDINETLKFVNSCIKLFQKYITEKDTQNLLTVQILLDHAYYNFGLGTPLYLKWAASRGGRKSKERKGIINVIEQLLRGRGISSPARMWKYLATNYNDPEKENRSIETTDLAYKVWFARDIVSNKLNDGLLYQQGMDGKEKSIKFKTFEALFYRVRNKIGPAPV